MFDCGYIPPKKDYLQNRLQAGFGQQAIVLDLLPDMTNFHEVIPE